MSELSGTVVGALLNDRALLAALGEAVHAAPYKAPPAAPVLCVKPRNTLAASGSVLATDGDAFELGATLGLVIGRGGCIAGAVLVADFSVPHASHYRPAVPNRARDGSCVIGPTVAAIDVDAAALRVEVDGVAVRRVRFDDRVRGAERLVADVREFMTLAPGDLLLMGAAHGAPVLRAGQRWSVACDGLGRIEGALA